LFSLGNNSLVNKSAIFDGLEEDEEELANIFVPRSSVKKLVLKPKVPPTIVSAGKKILHISYKNILAFMHLCFLEIFLHSFTIFNI
jgi:hypothetical protein